MRDFLRLHNKTPFKFLPRSSGPPPLQPPVNLSPPVVSGVNAVGSLLSVTAGVWSGDPSFAYQWQISADGLTGWADIAGATAETYAPVAGDASQFIRAIVTATNAAGTASAESNEAGPILRAPVNTGLPVITGTARVDELLTVSNGAWAAFPAPSFTYQWQRGATNISGATSSTYLITDADAGSALRCIVTASNTAGSASATSAATAVVLPFDWEWAGFDLTAGSDGVQWVGYSDGGATRPQPAFGSISGQPTPRTDLLALYDDTASGVFLAVFAGDFTARLAGIEVSFGGFVMDAFEVELIDGNTWARFIGLPGDLTPAAVYQVAFGFDLQAAPIITEQPSISPAAGRAGTRFVFDVGAAEGRPVPVASGSLTFNGVPVALDPEGGYTPSLPGSLVWSVEWSNGIAPDASAQATVEVADVFTPAELFTSGEVGWYEPLIPGVTLFQNSTAATPVTAPGQPVGLSLDASKGLDLGPEQRQNGVVTTSGAPPNVATYDPITGIGTNVRFNSANYSDVRVAIVANGVYQIDIENTGDTALSLRAGSPGGAIVMSVAPGTRLSRLAGIPSATLLVTVTGEDASGDFILHSLRELPGNHFRQPTALNRPIYQVDEEGNGYLAFNGTNQWMQTSAFAWASAEASVVLGVHKNVAGAGATGLVNEFGASINTVDGSFNITAPSFANGGNYGAAHRGLAPGAGTASATGAFPPPVSSVVSISGSLLSPTSLKLRVDGVQRGETTTAVPATYGTSVLYRGARTGVALFFNGRVYPNFGINRLLTPEEQAEAEAWAAMKSGVVL